MKQNDTVKKLALAGVLTAVAVVGSFISFPILGSKCAPVQHMVNVLAAVVLGPWWGVGIAFAASLIRNLLGLGSLMAFPGSMVGALCCGLAYAACRKLWLTCCAEAFGTGVLGGIADLSGCKAFDGTESNRIICLYCAISCFYSCGKYSGICIDLCTGKGWSTEPDTD